MSIKEVVAIEFGEVVIGKWEINEGFNLEASIELATGEIGKITVFFIAKKWHYMTAIAGIIEHGTFNGGANDSFNIMFTFLAKEGGLLHQTAIPMPTVCCEVCKNEEVHDNGLCEMCNEKLMEELV